MSKEKQKEVEPTVTEAEAVTNRMLYDAVIELTKEVGKLWKSHNDLIEVAELKKKIGRF